jgi:hypothetical protein
MASKKVDLNSKPFDSKLVGSWIPDKDQDIIFTEFYIEKKYSKYLHYLKYMDIELLNIERDIGSPVLEVGLIDYKTGEYVKTKKLTGKEEILEKYAKLYKNTNKRFTYFPLKKPYYFLIKTYITISF